MKCQQKIEEIVTSRKKLAAERGLLFSIRVPQSRHRS